MVSCMADVRNNFWRDRRIDCAIGRSRCATGRSFVYYCAASDRWRPPAVNPLTPTVGCHMGTAIKHPVPDRVKSSLIIFDIRALWRSATTNDGLFRSGTGWASEGWSTLLRCRQSCTSHQLSINSATRSADGANPSVARNDNTSVDVCVWRSRRKVWPRLQQMHVSFGSGHMYITSLSLQTQQTYVLSACMSHSVLPYICLCMSMSLVIS